MQCSGGLCTGADIILIIPRDCLASALDDQVFPIRQGREVKMALHQYIRSHSA
jgi:hypothetical protein